MPTGIVGVVCRCGRFSPGAFELGVLQDMIDV
jgi:hypothetical protein